MFRPMRRSGQELSSEECGEILRRGTSGVLALAGDGGYPYAVPLSYVFLEGKLYFHCAPTGHKLDAMAGDDRASFCVIDRDQVVPEKFTTCFRSVIVFGRTRTMEDPGEKRRALTALAEKYTPGDPEGCREEVEKTFGRVCLVELAPEHVTGKEAIELTRARKQ